MFPGLNHVNSHTQLASSVGVPQLQMPRAITVPRDIPEMGSPSDVILKRSTISMVALVLFTLKLYRYLADFTYQTITYIITITLA